MKPSKATTYIVAPLDVDGVPDYVAFLAQRKIGSRAHSDNGLLDLYAALGPQLLRDDARAFALRELRWDARAHGDPATPAILAKTAKEDAEAARLADALGKNCAGLSSADHVRVVEALSAGEASLERVHRASGRPYVYLPMVEGALPTVNALALVRAARVLRCRGTIRLEAGDPAGAGRDAQALLGLGNLLSTDQTMLVTAIGLLMLGSGSELSRTIADDPKTDSRTIDELRAALPSIDERAFALGLVEHERLERLAAGTGVFRHRGWDLEAMLRRINQTFDIVERAARVAAYPARTTALAAAEKELQARKAAKPSAFDIAICSALSVRCGVYDFMADALSLSEAETLMHTVTKAHDKLALIDANRHALNRSADGP